VYFLAIELFDIVYFLRLTDSTQLKRVEVYYGYRFCACL